MEARTPYDVLDTGTGEDWHRALLLNDVDANCQAVEDEFAYDLEEAAIDLLRLAKDLREHVSRLRIQEDATLLLANEDSEAS